MHHPNRAPRPQLTLAIMKFALLDVVGMLLLALGLGFFVQGQGAFLATFPSTTAEAVIATAGGVIVMGYAATRILREVMRQQGRIEE